MDSSLPSIPEIIGLFVAVVLALAFVSYLLYAKGRDIGLPRQRITRSLIAIWAVTLCLLALLFGLRALIGTPVIEGTPSTGGISIAQMTPAKWALVALAAALVVGASLWLRGVIEQFEPKRDLTALHGGPQPPSDEE